MKKAAHAEPNHQLTNVRLQKGWSQQEVADFIGTTRINISRWERGITIPTPYFRQRLSAFFQKDVEELGFFVSPTKKPPAQAETLPQSTTLAEPISPSWHPPYWHIPFQRNPLFTGREEILLAIQHIFHSSIDEALTRICIISGMGGIGKTQIAVEYAFRYRDNYQAVLWARGETYQVLIKDATTLARVLDISIDQKPAMMLREVQYWLRDHVDWLLVLDDATDPRVIDVLHASAHQGHILLTTQSQSIGLLGQRIHLGPMKIDEGALFLLRRARLLAPNTSLADATEEEHHLALQTTSLFGGLPLALDQAGAYIEETACSLADYLSFYDNREVMFLERRGVVTIGHERSVIETLQRSLQKVEQDDLTAVDLLKLCAYLDPEAIPIEIITRGTSVLEVPVSIFAANALAFNSALATLRRYSLIERDPLNKTLSLHPLVQEVVRKKIDEHEKGRWQEYIIKAVWHVFSAGVVSMAQPFQSFVRQARVCAQLIEQENMVFPEAIQLVYYTGRYLLAQAEAVLQKERNDTSR